MADSAAKIRLDRQMMLNLQVLLNENSYLNLKFMKSFQVSTTFDRRQQLYHFDVPPAAPHAGAAFIVAYHHHGLR